MSYLSHKQRKEDGICHKTDVIFVARDAFVERIYMEDLLAKRNVTAMSYPCVVDLNCRNSNKPRPDRSRVSGLRSEAFGDLIFLDHGSTHIGDQTVGFLIVLDGATTNFTAYSCKSTSPSEVISQTSWLDEYFIFRWIRWRFVQTWLSIILIFCKHSVECIMWRDFLLDHTQWMWSFLYV